MERQFKVAARYRAYVNAGLALILAEVGRDMKRRDEGRKPTVPSFLIDPTLPGNVTIRVTWTEATVTKRVARRRAGATTP